VSNEASFRHCTAKLRLAGRVTVDTMADTGRSQHLARNAALAALVIFGSTAAVTAGAVQPGARSESCPDGEDWVVARPVEVTVTRAHSDRGAPADAGTASSRTPTRSAASPAGGSAQTAAAPLTLAGCVDTARLSPVPVGGDGRG
jgi:hypothetical protein